MTQEPEPEIGKSSPWSAAPVYAVLGDPVAHSLSPLMHNRAFAAAGRPGVYVALRVADIAGAVAGLRALGIAGASVTVPHKIAVMAHLDDVSETARAVGAVNTVVNRGGRLFGDNTDVDGAVFALTEKTRLAGKTLAVLGAGGAARAVAYGAAREGARIVVVNRSVERGWGLAKAFDGRCASPADFTGDGVDILVNATPVGMHPDTGALPVDENILSPEMVVMDAVYNPIQTRLLRAAKKRGCTTIDGVSMFVCQGARQFTLWTGQAAPLAEMRNAVVSALNRGGFSRR